MVKQIQRLQVYGLKPFEPHFLHEGQSCFSLLGMPAMCTNFLFALKLILYVTAHLRDATLVV